MTFRARLILLLLVCVAFVVTMVSTNPGLSLDVVAAAIDRGHPSVPTVQAAALERVLRERLARRPLLIDVRTPAEYAVSHLPKAINVPDGANVALDPRLADLPRTADIVVYCAVGYRSARATAALRQAGFTNVRNLSGGIFGWANDGLSIVTPDRRGPRVVHPYSALWGALLAPEHRAAI